MRDQRGQTAPEIVGMLLLVGVIVFAIVAVKPADAIADGAKRAICLILQQDCAADPGDGGDGGDPPQGPPLGGQDIPVLPFPGSVTVTCTYDPRTPESCTPGGQSGVSVQASGELKVERTPTSLDYNGCPWQTASLSTSFKLSANAEAKGSRASGKLSGYLGQNTNYSITTSPDQMDAIAGGDREPPNPIDPTTIAAGESVTLTEDFYAGIGAKGSYRALQVEMGYDEGTRVSSAVRRVSPSTVRVYVGDSEFVKSALKLGVGAGDFGLYAGNTKDLADGKLHSVDIDISTPEGWTAYQDFLASGRLPQQGTAGTSNHANADTIVYTDVTTIEAKLGGLKLGGRVGDSEGRVTQTTNEDGTVDTVAYARWNDVALAVTRREDANGNPIGTPTRSLLLEGVDPNTVGSIYELTGHDRPSNPDSNLRLDFSEDDLDQLRQNALTILADRIRNSNNGLDPTPEDVANSIHNGVIEIDGVQFDFGGVESLLAEATTPEEMLMALYHGGLGSSAVAESLLNLLLDHPADMDIINQPSC